jgi:hypothetical protein
MLHIINVENNVYFWLLVYIYVLLYYDTFSKIQRIQSINKQTEYDNLVLEQDILSKKN